MAWGKHWLNRNKISAKGDKDLFLEVPFGTDSCPVRKKVGLQRVMCYTLYLKSVYHKKSYKRVAGVRTILHYSKLSILYTSE